MSRNSSLKPTCDPNCDTCTARQESIRYVALKSRMSCRIARNAGFWARATRSRPAIAVLRTSCNLARLRHAPGPYRSDPSDVHFAGLQNLLRLRTDYRYNNRIAAEIGADFNIQQQSVFPAATLQYEVVAKDRHWGALQATTQGLNFRKTFTLQRKQASCSVTGKLGYSFEGRPNIGIDIGSIKPWQTVLVGALGLVAAGKPVTGDKRFPGDFSVTLPGIKTGLAQGEIKATIQKGKNGFSLNFNQMNGVLML